MQVEKVVSVVKAVKVAKVGKALNDEKVVKIVMICEWACVIKCDWIFFFCEDCDDFLVCCLTGELDLGGGITYLLYPTLKFF